VSVVATDDDEVLWQELQQATREPDAVPPEFAAAARAAFTWRTVDAELLRLTEDAAMLEATRAAGTTERRVLEFAGAQLSVTVELSSGLAEGQVLPPGSGRVAKATLDGASVEVEVDDSGYFRFAVGDQETFRLQLATEGAAYVTQWVTP
jgi:hypothetical protein